MILKERIDRWYVLITIRETTDLMNTNYKDSLPAVLLLLYLYTIFPLPYMTTILIYLPIFTFLVVSTFKIVVIPLLYYYSSLPYYLLLTSPSYLIYYLTYVLSFSKIRDPKET